MSIQRGDVSAPDIRRSREHAKQEALADREKLGTSNPCAWDLEHSHGLAFTSSIDAVQICQTSGENDALRIPGPRAIYSGCQNNGLPPKISRRLSSPALL